MKMQEKQRINREKNKKQLKNVVVAIQLKILLSIKILQLKPTKRLPELIIMRVKITVAVVIAVANIITLGFKVQIVHRIQKIISIRMKKIVQVLVGHMKKLNSEKGIQIIAFTVITAVKGNQKNVRCYL